MSTIDCDFSSHSRERFPQYNNIRLSFIPMTFFSSHVSQVDTPNDWLGPLVPILSLSLFTRTNPTSPLLDVTEKRCILENARQMPLDPDPGWSL
jgi:hypothetical protein